jgi:hypothetical protein
VPERSNLLLGATIGATLLYVAAYTVLGTPPEGDDSGREVVRWLDDHEGRVRTWLWLLTLSLPLFVVVAVLVRERLPRLAGDLFFFGSLALVVQAAVQGWLWAGMTWHSDQLDPATARTLLDVAQFWGPVLTATTITMLAPIVPLALRGEHGLPRWLGALAAVTVLEQLVETVTIFGDDGFIAPGGPMNVILGAALVGATLLALGIVLALRGRPA